MDKQNIKLQVSNIAPCGMNCALCLAYQREKNRCGGCNGPDNEKIHHCFVCSIKNCNERPTGKTGLCSSCNKFPCTRLKILDKRYREKYGMSMIANLNDIEKNGMEKFIKKEEIRWGCEKCGKLLCIHREDCQNCGFKNKFKSLGLYKKTEKFVIDSFNKANRSFEIKHFTRTVYWLKRLSPATSEAMLTAAVAHDIERAFMKNNNRKHDNTAGITSLEFIREHEKRGAKIMEKFLKSQNADKVFIEKVKILISKHEEGGTEEQNLLMDADTISFFENNVRLFVAKKVSEIGKDEVYKKFNWMYSRINFPEAKRISKPFYQEAIKNLDTI